MQKNDPAVTVDYNIGDPVVRWDSYENFNERFQDSLEGECALMTGRHRLSKQTNTHTHTQTLFFFLFLISWLIPWTRGRIPRRSA